MLAVLSMANTDNYGCELGVRGRGGGVHGRSVPNGTMNLALGRCFIVGTSSSSVYE